MLHRTALFAAAISSVATFSNAQEFVGGSLSAEYVFNNGGDATSYSGAAEVSLGQQFGVGLEFNSVDSESAATLHGIYHLSGNSSVGLYYGQSLSDGSDATSIGIEGGTALGYMSVGGYLGQISEGSTNLTTFGLNADGSVANSFGTYFNYDYVGNSSASVGTSEFGVDYTFDQGPELFAHYGWVSATAVSSTASSDYIGIGARIKFGSQRGTTFGSR